MPLYAGKTLSLLHGDGVNGSTTITDEMGGTRVASGSVRISSANAKFDQSIEFYGNGSVAVNIPDTIPKGIVTLECWVNTAFATGSIMAVFGRPFPSAPFLGITAAGKLTSQLSGSWVDSTGAGLISSNTWAHIAIVFNGISYWTFFINGVASGGTSGIAQSLSDLQLGYAAANWPYRGFIDDVRVTEGYSPYLLDFTPPTAPLGLLQVNIKALAPVSGVLVPFNPSQAKPNTKALTPVSGVLVPFNPSQAKPVMQVTEFDCLDRLPYGTWTRPGDFWETKGRGVITGTVKEQALPNNVPRRRLVRLHREPDGMFVKAVWSDAGTGEYSFVGVRLGIKYTVTCYDYTLAHRAAIADRVVPTVLP